jgi:predicted branched-subunit amino acid permease
MNYDTFLEVNRGFAYGLRQSLTIVIGYAPVAVTFGILATQFGLTFWEAGLMSFFVYAGAAQFIAIEMIYQRGYRLDDWPDDSHS